MTLLRCCARVVLYLVRAQSREEDWAATTTPFVTDLEEFVLESGHLNNVNDEGELKIS